MLFLPFSSIHCLSSLARCKKHKKLPSKEEVSPQRKSLRHKKGEKPSSLTVSLSSPRLLPSLIYWLAAFLHGRKKPPLFSSVWRTKKGPGNEGCFLSSPISQPIFHSFKTALSSSFSYARILLLFLPPALLFSLEVGQ